MAFKTLAEKIAYRKGKKQGQKECGCNVKKKNVKKRKWFDTPDGIVASRYANHMGAKYNLNDDEVLINSLNHYQEMKRNKKFRDDLYDEYGVGFEKYK